MSPHDVTAALGRVRAERPLLDFAALDHAAARTIGGMIADLADARAWPIAVEVFLGEQRVFHAAFTGSTAENDDWMLRKRRTARHHDLSSFEVALTTRLSGRDPIWLDPRRYAIAGGAVPLRVRGLLVGTVALSGLVESEQADHDAVIEGIARYRDSLR